MLLDKTVTELSEGLKKKKWSCEEIVKECFENIEKYNSKINAFITILNKEEVVKRAREKDATLSSAVSPLYGLPFVLKDSYNTKGIRTTAASQILGNYVSQYDATVYKRLMAAGALLVGKMNMDAWGHGATNENTDFGPVKNPWDITRVSGGSSGGPAAAIAARMAVFGIGEDTGGSIRNPSAWCNTTGLKVTYGRVSRYGCIAYASSFDTVGPMAKSVEDCAHILHVIAGKDPHDATSSPTEVNNYSEHLQQTVKGKVLGIPKELYGSGLDSEIKLHIEKALQEFEKLGVITKEVSMPKLEYGLPVYYLIAPSETSSNLARYDGVRYGIERKNFTPETMRRIMIGTYALSAGYYDAYYKKAQQVRTLFIEEYNKALSQCDALIMPVTLFSPTKLGELIDDPIQNMLTDFYTVTQNPVGIPSLAIPCGFTQNKLPIGMQLVGKMFDESLLFRLGHAYQSITNWHTEKPPLL